jgi:hypothetical protein
VKILVGQEKLLSDLSLLLKLIMMSFTQNQIIKTYNHNYKYNPDANYKRFQWRLINSLEYRQAVNNSTFFSVKGSYNIYDFKRYLFPLLDESGK